jgi:hypothetical protein
MYARSKYPSKGNQMMKGEIDYRVTVEWGAAPAEVIPFVSMPPGSVGVLVFVDDTRPVELRDPSDVPSSLGDAVCRSRQDGRDDEWLDLASGLRLSHYASAGDQTLVRLVMPGDRLVLERLP